MAAITYTPLNDEILHGRGSVGTKEHEPIGAPVTIQKVEGEHRVSQDLMEYVEQRPEQIILSPELQSAGVRYNASLRFPESNSITLPLPGTKEKEGEKKPVGDSFRWLAELSRMIGLKKSV